MHYRHRETKIQRLQSFFGQPYKRTCVTGLEGMRQFTSSSTLRTATRTRLYARAIIN